MAEKTVKYCNGCGNKVPAGSVCSFCASKARSESGLVFCNACGQEVSEDAAFCKFCGQKTMAKVAAGRKQYCRWCGQGVSREAGFCASCGKQLEYVEKASEKESRRVQALGVGSLKPGEAVGAEKVVEKKGLGAGWVVLIVIGSVIVLYLFLTFMSDGGAQRTVVDPCERAYDGCVHDCGDGILSGLCREGCTWDRDKCWKAEG